MIKRNPLVALCVSTTAVVVSPTLALGETDADWPCWRGADRTGVSPETGWSPVANERPLWRKKIGFGHSSFAVSDGRLFALGYDAENGVDVVYCIDPETGEEHWTHTYPAEFWNEGHDGGTCTTPAVEDGTVYVSNREGKLSALRADSGSVIWSRDLRGELGVTPPRWGFSGSPVVVGDQVIANVSKLASFSKATGELNWISERELGNAYSTPIEFDFNGRPSILVLNGLGLAVIDQKDGAEITFYSWSRNPERAVYGATPVIVGSNRIFISAAANGGCVMLEPNEDDGLDVVWESRAMRASYAGPILYDDHIYGFDASILKCIDLEGNTKWRQRGIGLGAVVVVGGRLVIVGAKGELIIAEATPEAYVELSRVRALDGGANWATPVLSHGLLFARNSLGDMICQDHRVKDGLASARKELPTDMPDASRLLAKHVDAIGGADALRRMQSVHLTGRGQSQGNGPLEYSDAQLAWSADGAFVWRFASGLEFGYNPRLGWTMGGRTAILEPDKIAELREVGDLHRLLADNWGYTNLETATARVFDDRLCYIVSAEVENGGKRTLYFDAETGLLAGQEGEELPLWTFNDYRRVGDVLIPHDWSMFAADSGSMTAARFSEATVNEYEPSHHEPPTLIRMMTRTPEEKEAANEQLRATYGHLVGNYQLATGSMVGTPVPITIAEGGLQLSFGGGPGDFLSEPDAEGRMILMSQPQIYVQITETDAGRVLTMWAYGDEFGRMEVPSEDGE